MAENGSKTFYVIIAQEPSLMETFSRPALSSHEKAHYYENRHMCHAVDCEQPAAYQVNETNYCEHHWITRMREYVYVDSKVIGWRSTPDQQRYEVFWAETGDPECYPLMTVTHAADAHWLLMIYKERFARGEFSILF